MLVELITGTEDSAEGVATLPRAPPDRVEGLVSRP